MLNNLAKRLSKSKMKGFDMGWELTFFHFIPHAECITWFELNADGVWAGDHSPRAEFRLIIFNFCVFEINWLNSYHEAEDEDGYTYQVIKRDKKTGEVVSLGNEEDQ